VPRSGIDQEECSGMSPTSALQRLLHTTVALLLAGCASLLPPGSADGRCAVAPKAMPGEPRHGHWERSYRAGCPDARGVLAAGSEVMHLVPHGGRLYAATGMWMDPRNPLYGAWPDVGVWAQILRLDAPDAAWQVDLELPDHLRAEALASLTLSTDAQGRALPAPQTLLLAAAYAHGRTEGGSAGLHLFTRDDAQGRWERSLLLPGPTGQRGEPNSVRVLRVHRDRVTGVDRVFATLGVHGVRSGVFDANAPGRIRWDEGLEIAGLPVRPLAMAQAGGELYLSTGAQILRRIDGPRPRWEPFFSMAGQSDLPVHPPAGGIRGLSGLPSPVGGESLLFVWAPGPDSPACVYRIDPPGPRAPKAVEEVCLRDLVQRHLEGSAVRSVLAAYNDIPAIVLPSGDTVHLIGLQAWMAQGRHALSQPHQGHGFYAGAMVAVREGAGRYRMAEVNGPALRGAPPLVAARTFARSPFAAPHDGVLYVGGHDCNFVRCSDTAWVFRAPVSSWVAR
jgi:poly(A) polymerase